MNYPLFIARRLSLASGGHRSSPAVVVATTAVALSVAVMIAAIAIVTGFKQEISDKVVGFNSHLNVTISPNDASTDGNILLLSSSLKQILDNQPYIVDYNLQSSIPAILKTPEDFKGVYMKNIPLDLTRDFLQSNLEEGNIPDFSNTNTQIDILLSRHAANSLNLKVGDSVDSYFLSDDIRVRKLKIAGIFNSHFDNYDNIYIYGSLPLIQKLANIKANEGTSILITTDNLEKIDEYAAMLDKALVQAKQDGFIYKSYQIETARTRGAGYFQWLGLLDLNVIVVLTLMTVVACITLISGMLIVIADKKNFIGVMKSLGCPNVKLRNIFIFLALRITIIGLLIGNIISIGVLAVQKYTHIIPLDADSYYIDFVPVELSWLSIAALNVGVLIIVYIALILPSRFVARIAPAESMRNE